MRLARCRALFLAARRFFECRDLLFIQQWPARQGGGSKQLNIANMANVNHTSSHHRGTSFTGMTATLQVGDWASKGSAAETPVDDAATSVLVGSRTRAG